MEPHLSSAPSTSASTASKKKKPHDLRESLAASPSTLNYRSVKEQCESALQTLRELEDEDHREKMAAQQADRAETYTASPITVPSYHNPDDGADYREDLEGYAEMGREPEW